MEGKEVRGDELKEIPYTQFKLDKNFKFFQKKKKIGDKGNQQPLPVGCTQGKTSATMQER